MAIVAGQLHSQGTNLATAGSTAIDTILTQEANRIGPDIHRRTLHVSPWLDLIKQSAFPEGMGSTLGTLIYDRALPTTTSAGGGIGGGGTLGLTWTTVGGNANTDAIANPAVSNLSQIIPGATDTNIGPASGKSFIQFSRQFKQYALKRAVVESPRINVEDLRYAAFRTEQLRAIMDSMTESTRYSMEERYRDEYDRLCKNVIICKTTGTVNLATKENSQSWDIDYGTSSDIPDANISNKIMDSVYFRLVRAGAGGNAYGRENARPVFAAVMSSEASYRIVTETGFRDDYRYNNSKVGDLIAPLGIERSHRGFYHLIDDLAPRMSDDGDGTLTRVHPYSASSGVISDNASYETAAYENIYILHADVMESQIPSPNVSGPGLTFNPVDYKGKYSWLNIQDEILNPDKTIGFFRGVIATASKPLKTEFGTVIMVRRDLTTLAA